MRKSIVTVCASLVLAAGLTATRATAQATSQPAQQRHGQMGAILEQLDLTATQKAQVKAIMQQAHKDAQAATDPAGKGKIRQAAFEKIKTTVLTADQRTKLSQLVAQRGGSGATSRPMGPLTGLGEKLGLSDAQKAQVKTIIQQAHKDAQAVTDPAGKRKIMQAAFEKIKTTVLTADQRTKLNELRAQRQANRNQTSQPAGE